MFIKRARIALLAGLVLASAPMALRAFEDEAPADKAPAEKAPAEKEKIAPPKDKGTPAPVMAAPMSGCGGCGATAGCGTRIVYVNEYVPEYYKTTRTTYKTEWKEEAYTATRTEMVTETKKRLVTTYSNVETWEDRIVTKCIDVPTVETRTVMKKVEVCKPVTVHHRKLVRLGHWECREVTDHLASFRHRLGGLGHRCCDPCDPCASSCAPVTCTKTVKVWKHCPVYEDCCETKMVKSWECVPTTCQVTVCKKVPVQEKVKVCVRKCVPCTKEETYTCCVPKCVSYPATRKVAHCVPCTEEVTACRMVCRQVAREVADTGCETSCCHRRFSFGSLFSRGHGHSCSSCGSGCH